MQLERIQKLIADIVCENMKMNPDVFEKEDLVKQSLPIQIAVGSTIQVLLELELIDSSKLISKD